MSDDLDRIDTEEQRARALNALRHARKAVVVTIDDDGEPSVAYINVTPIEHRGLAALISDTAPKWRLTDDDEG